MFKNEDQWNVGEEQDKLNSILFGNTKHSGLKSSKSNFENSRNVKGKHLIISPIKPEKEEKDTPGKILKSKIKRKNLGNILKKNDDLAAIIDQNEDSKNLVPTHQGNEEAGSKEKHKVKKKKRKRTFLVENSSRKESLEENTISNSLKCFEVVNSSFKNIVNKDTTNMQLITKTKKDNKIRSINNNGIKIPFSNEENQIADSRSDSNGDPTSKPLYIIKKKKKKMTCSENFSSYRSSSIENNFSKKPKYIKSENNNSNEDIVWSIFDKNSNSFFAELKTQTRNYDKFQEKLCQKLEGGQFRWINERLYTCKSNEAMQMFSKDPRLFNVYHEGFEFQVLSWPENPVDLVIDYIKERSKSAVIADFGCGDARIARSVKNQVHSFDLVALNKHVTICDIKKVPLANRCIDIAVFCLSLMGVNFVDFLVEAKRVLKRKGLLKIAEVKSRFDDVIQFVKDVETLGFTLIDSDESNKMFVMFEFEKNDTEMKNRRNFDFKTRLKPCMYKRR